MMVAPRQLLTAIGLLSISTITASVPDIFNCFLYFNNHFLEKSGTRVVRNVSTVAVCLDQCLTAQYTSSLHCRSVMWKKHSRDCILSRWSISQRPKHLKVSQKMDVDLYENTCFGETMPKSTVYATSDQTMARTTISPNSGEEKGTTTAGKLKKKDTTDFRRVRAHHTRSLAGTPLPPTAFHRLDRESSLPPLAKTKRSHTSLQTSNEDKIVISPQLDEPSWVQKLASKPIRKGKIIPHLHAITTRKPAVTGTRELVETRDVVGTTPFSLPTSLRSTPCFGRVRHHFLPHFEERTVRGVTVRQCLLTCLNTSTFFCASAHYDDSKKSCTLNGGNVHLNRGKLVGRAGVDYFENRCHLGDRDEQLEQVTSPIPKIVKKAGSCFEERRNTVLASLDAMVIQHLKNLDECTTACSTGPMTCTGLNWIPSTNGCMLFHGEIDKTQLTDGPGSSFYSNNCSGKHQATHRQTRTKNEDFYDD